MAGDHLQRFDQWRHTLPERTMYLTNLVIDEIVPVFQEQGFNRFSDYAGGSANAVGANCVAMQRRSGPQWPTVEIVFDRRKRPALGVNFSVLPEICYRQTQHGTKQIPRLDANVVEGEAFFILCKGHHSNLDGNFGYYWFALRPEFKLKKEIAVLKSLLPWLLSAFEKGIPDAWYRTRGYVDQHAFISPASYIFRNRGER